MEIFDGDIRPYDDWEPYQNNRYFNAVTVTYGELVDGGFIDWTDPAFSWDYYDEEQKARVQLLKSRINDGADQVGKVVIINDTNDPHQ